MQRHSLVIGLVAGVVLAAAVLVVVGLIVVYSGSYNVAALDRHADVVRWAFDTTMHRSVRDRAEEVVEPETVTAEQISAGAETYAATCVHCHAAPGVERAHWADGMRPVPPHLVEAAPEWEAREVFWIVKNGIKMSGMPSFAGGHDDAAIWGIAAFVKRLPAMTPEDYAAFTGSGAAGDPAAE